MLLVLCMGLSSAVAKNAAMMSALTEMLNATTHHHVQVQDVGSQQEQAAKVSLNRAALSALNDPVLEDPADEQTRLNTLRRTFLGLPAAELSVYATLLQELEEHGQEPIPTDSALAASLQVAWDQRQRELKAAMDSIVKPVQLMTGLIDAILYRRTEGAHTRAVASEEGGAEGPDAASHSDLSAGAGHTRASALEQLQDVLDDVDNARDFHTVGGFDALAAVLDPLGYSPDTDEEQGLAALALGNAIKNQYDFQKWVLEPTAQPTLLLRLLHLLAAGSEKSKRRALYAISSAARGNLDVQASLRDFRAEGAGPSLSAMLLREMAGGAEAEAEMELPRKVLAFVADMLEEHTFIQGTMASPADLAEPGLSEEQAQAQVAEILAQLAALQPVGEHFCDAEWVRAGFRALARSTQLLQAHGQLSVGAALPRSYTTPRAVAENAVTMLGKIVDCPRLSPHATHGELRILHDAIAWAHAAGDSAGDIATTAESLLHLLSQK